MDQSSHIQTQIADEREWMRRIDGQRCEDWKNRCLEVVVNPESLVFVELLVIQQMGTVRMKLILQSAAVMLLLLVQKSLYCLHWYH